MLVCKEKNHIEGQSYMMNKCRSCLAARPRQFKITMVFPLRKTQSMLEEKRQENHMEGK